MPISEIEGKWICCFPNQFFLHVGSALEEKKDFLLQKLIFSSCRFRAHIKKRKIFFCQFRTVYLKIFKSRLSQASCSDFFLKSKLMRTCFKNCCPSLLEKKKNQFSPRDGSGFSFFFGGGGGSPKYFFTHGGSRLP